MDKKSQNVRTAVIFILLLHFFWMGAWVLKLALESHHTVLSTSMWSSIYWLALKLVMWVVPAIVIINRSGLQTKRVWRRTVTWGGGIGLLLGVIAIATRLFLQQAIFSSPPLLVALNVVAMAPVSEELVFRGVLLPALKIRYSFFIANVVTSIAFMTIHFPGWYFQGRLISNLMNPIGGALAILLLGFVFGVVAHKSNSIAGSIFAHSLNNLFNL